MVGGDVDNDCGRDLQLRRLVSVALAERGTMLRDK